MRGGQSTGKPDENKVSEPDTAGTSGADSIDERLYSRQLYVLGHEAMRRMQKCSILLVGLGGLGVEIAKNLALAGVKSLTLHDPRPIELSDLSSHFYCTEADVGKNRANVSRDRLADLNQYVKIDVLEGPVGAAELANFSLVLCTDACFGECVAVNDACRAHGIAFIMAQVLPPFSAMRASLTIDALIRARASPPLFRTDADLVRSLDPPRPTARRRGMTPPPRAGQFHPPRPA